MNLFDLIGSGYKVAFISAISSLVLIFGLYIYRFIYPKKKISLFILLILISLLPVISAFRPGLYESGDFNIHIYRSIEFYRSLTYGHIMPSWAGELNVTYGYPLFIFNYTLPYYFVCLLHFFGLSFVLSMKFFLVINFLLSAIFMFLATKKLFGNDVAAFVSTIFYQFAPYHLVDLNFKIAFGEIMIFTMLPVLFFVLLKLWEKRNILFLSLASFCGALLIMSHSVTALLIFGLIFSYSGFLSIIRKDKYYFLSTIVVSILSCLASSYLWLGPLFLNQYTITSKMTITSNTYGMNLWNLIYSPWRFGFLFQGPKGQINAPLGYTHIFVVFVLLISLFKKKVKTNDRSHIYFWLISFFIVTFLATIYSSFIWSQIKILILSTSPERLPIIIVFILSILAGYFTQNYLKRKFFLFFFILLTILLGILNWGQRRVISTMGEQNLVENLPYSTYQAEAHWYANSRWRNVSDPWFRYIPAKHIEILKGQGEFKEIKRESEIHSYIMSVGEDVRVLENTLYFPGWNAYIDGKKVLTAPDANGVIAFNVYRGLHFVEVRYEDIPIYKYTKIISLIFFLGLLLTIIFVSLKRKFNY